VQKYLTIAVLAALTLGSVASAEYVWQYSDTQKLTLGADIRTRLYHMDENVMNPVADNEHEGFLRVRERVWANFAFSDDTRLSIRLVNQWRYYWTSGADPNNSKGGVRYRFPDEVVFDKFVLDLNNVLDTNWSLSIGRQDIILGNGMVVLEGTPYDAGRTIYFDAIVATYANDNNNLKLLATYNNYRDKTLVINDQKRPLMRMSIDSNRDALADDGTREPDVTMAGAYWTHNLRDNLNFDLYYLYMDADDARSNSRTAIDNVGTRIFGEVSPTVGYSAEYARQFGKLHTAAGGESDLAGQMFDLRLNLKPEAASALDPKLTLQYTLFTGDKLGSASKNEGWVNIFARYPIWREDITAYIMNQSGFNNFEQYRATMTMNMASNVKTLFSYGLMNAHRSTPSGDKLGQLVHAAVDWQVRENVSVSLDAAYFFAGNAYSDGKNGEWIMLQGIYSF